MLTTLELQGKAPFFGTSMKKVFFDIFEGSSFIACLYLPVTFEDY